ncbi:MAG: Hsp33 family molecular chaperone HslO [Rhodocyclaceae bacterium]|nr:Hsp33 family molecular chaperone HslO [Rhodocyclaceae bacterium]
MADAISRFLFERLDIRGVVVQLGSSWRDMLAGRGYPDAVRDLLGQLAAVTAVIGGNLKSENRMSFQLQGGGPVSILVMDCQPITNGPLRLRGMARMRGEESIAVLPEPTCGVTDLLGDGKLVLTLHQGDAQAYQSVVPLDGNTVAQVFEHYLAQSEQQPARLWLHADEDSACALFLQTLPGAHEKEEDGWNRVAQLASTVKPGELQLPPEVLISRLFAEEEVRLFESRAVCWHCPRDEQKVKDMLLTLGRSEVEQMLADADQIEVDDEICGHAYQFGREILDELFPPAGRVLH